MSVAEERDAIWRQADDLVNGVGEGLRGLVRQSVNQVDVDAVETKGARRMNQIARDFIRLDAVNRPLDRLVKILNAHAQAVEAEAAQGFQVFAGGNTRVHLDADFSVGRKREAFAGVAEKIFELCRGRIRGSAA